MNVSAALLDSSRRFRDERVSHPALFSEAATPIREDSRRLDLQVKSVLKRSGLTMRHVSAETSMRFGEGSPYFVPQTFSYKQKSGVTPHICQVVALSEVTGYRFSDWMNMCGFDLGLILALQLRIPNERTTILTATHLAPVSNSSFEGSNSTERRHHHRFYYAKIGSRDAVVYPKLRPGSIVRADRFFSAQILKGSSAHDHLWLVEHPDGITCCHVNLVGNKQVVLLPNRPPLSPWPLHLSTQARILGLVDGEVRSPEAEEFDPVGKEASSDLFPLPSSLRGSMNLSRLLRRSRLRIGLTFREAHKMTLRVSRFMHNRNFGIAAGLLSDYEAMNKFPSTSQKSLASALFTESMHGKSWTPGGYTLMILESVRS
jgi:hypothetical protein